MVKKLPAMQEMQVRSLGREDPLEKQVATYSSVLAWRKPQTEESGGLRPTGSQGLDTTVMKQQGTWVKWNYYLCIFTPPPKSISIWRTAVTLCILSQSWTFNRQVSLNPSQSQEVIGRKINWPWTPSFKILPFFPHLVPVLCSIN